MTAITMVLDAANIAFERGRAGGRYVFARVEAVRDVWQRRDVNGQVHAVIDASVFNRMVDRERGRQAMSAGWLTVATGDADDEILRLSDEYKAKIISWDNFVHAADRYSWLRSDRDRLYEVAWRDGKPQVRRRRPIEVTPQKIAEAKRRKALKAGDPGDVGDRQWRCTGPPDRCDYSGQIVPRAEVVKRGSNYYCRSSQHELEEVLVAEPVQRSGPATVTLLHRALVRWEMVIPAEGMTLGRRSARHSDVVDVTDGLDDREAREISGEHLRLVLDDTGLPVATHLRESNWSYVNPTIGEGGLPADNLMMTSLEYPLWPGDEVLLGPGTVRLLIDGEAS